MDIRVIRPGEGELAFGGPMGLRIIEDGSHTRHRLGLVEATLEPGPGRGHPLSHIHREHEGVFIVTKGKVRFTSGTESFDAEAGTVVVVPSLTLDQDIMARVSGAHHYEERMLCLLLLLRLPRTNVVYVSSAPVSETIVEPSGVVVNFATSPRLE